MGIVTESVSNIKMFASPKRCKQQLRMILTNSFSTRSRGSQPDGDSAGSPAMYNVKNHKRNSNEPQGEVEGANTINGKPQMPGKLPAPKNEIDDAASNTLMSSSAASSVSSRSSLTCLSDLSTMAPPINSWEILELAEEIKLQQHLTRPIETQPVAAASKQDRQTKPRRKRGDRLRRAISRVLLGAASGCTEELESNDESPIEPKTAQFILSDLDDFQERSHLTESTFQEGSHLTVSTIGGSDHSGENQSISATSKASVEISDPTSTADEVEERRNTDFAAVSPKSPLKSISETVEQSSPGIVMLSPNPRDTRKDQKTPKHSAVGMNRPLQSDRNTTQDTLKTAKEQRRSARTAGMNMQRPMSPPRLSRAAGLNSPSKLRPLGVVQSRISPQVEEGRSSSFPNPFSGIENQAEKTQELKDNSKSNKVSSPQRFQARCSEGTDNQKLDPIFQVNVRGEEEEVDFFASNGDDWTSFEASPFYKVSPSTKAVEVENGFSKNVFSSSKSLPESGGHGVTRKARIKHVLSKISRKQGTSSTRSYDPRPKQANPRVTIRPLAKRPREGRAATIRQLTNTGSQLTLNLQDKEKT